MELVIVVINHGCVNFEFINQQSLLIFIHALHVKNSFAVQNVIISVYLQSQMLTLVFCYILSALVIPNRYNLSCLKEMYLSTTVCTDDKSRVPPPRNQIVGSTRLLKLFCYLINNSPRCLEAQVDRGGIFAGQM